MVTDELLAHYRPLADQIARRFYLPGADADDVRQEAMIGLWLAARAFDGRGDFRSFAALVIRRRLITALKTARGGGRMLLTGALREIPDPHDRRRLAPSAEVLEDPAGDAHDRVVEIERVRAVVRAFHEELSPLEREAVRRYTRGEPYSGDKVIDNALTRARVKLRRAA